MLFLELLLMNGLLRVLLIPHGDRENQFIQILLAKLLQVLQALRQGFGPGLSNVMEINKACQLSLVLMPKYRLLMSSAQHYEIAMGNTYV